MLSTRWKGKVRAKGLRAFICDPRGGAAIEFGMVAAPVLFLLVGAVQLFLLFQSQEVLDTAAEVAGRQILTGAVQKQSMTAAQFKTVVCNYVSLPLDCSNVMVDVQVASSFAGANTSKPTMTYDNQGNVSNTWQFKPGNAGDIVVLRLIYQWPFFSVPGLNANNLANGMKLMMSTSVFKNESSQ